MNTNGWYKFTTEECPLCGKRHKYKEFISSIVQLKPVLYDDRHIFNLIYDYCDEY